MLEVNDYVYNRENDIVFIGQVKEIDEDSDLHLVEGQYYDGQLANPMWDHTNWEEPSELHKMNELILNLEINKSVRAGEFLERMRIVL